jgi:hypothetical protein
VGSSCLQRERDRATDIELNCRRRNAGRQAGREERDVRTVGDNGRGDALSWAAREEAGGVARVHAAESEAVRGLQTPEKIGGSTYSTRDSQTDTDTDADAHSRVSHAV